MVEEREPLWVRMRIVYDPDGNIYSREILSISEEFDGKPCGGCDEKVSNE